MQNLNQFILGNISAILIALLALFLLMTLFFTISILKYRKVNKRYNTLMRGMNDKNLEEILFQYLKKVEAAMDKVDDLEVQYKKLVKISHNSIQKVGIVRFNAFENTGSDLSFAIALLDAYKNGVIISSLFSRHDSRIYAKPVIDGVSTYNLSNEEKAALNQALNKQ